MKLNTLESASYIMEKHNILTKFPFVASKIAKKYFDMKFHCNIESVIQQSYCNIDYMYFRTLHSLRNTGSESILLWCKEAITLA